MAYSSYRTYATSTTGEQPSVNLDPSITPFSVTVAVHVVGGSASFGLEWSFDDFATVTDANAVWFTDKLIPTGTTADTYENYNTPATRMRINIATNTGGIQLKVLQGYCTN
jgi:hypothetical protein